MTAYCEFTKASPAFVYVDRLGADPLPLAYGEAAVLPRQPKRWPLWARVVRDLVGLGVLVGCGWLGVVLVAVAR